MNKGQLAQSEKVLHPGSRKVIRQAKKMAHRSNIDSRAKVGLGRLAALGDRLSWVREALPGVEGEDGKVSCAGMLQLIEGILTRFDEEIEQIKLKNSIGKSRKHQHSSRLDAIELAVKADTSDLATCGLEMPDLFDAKNLRYFREWEGELRFVQNISLKRFRRADLEAGLFEAAEEAEEKDTSEEAAPRTAEAMDT